MSFLPGNVHVYVTNETIGDDNENTSLEKVLKQHRTDC